jgi:hypothetical protein
LIICMPVESEHSLQPKIKRADNQCCTNTPSRQ